MIFLSKISIFLQLLSLDTTWAVLGTPPPVCSAVLSPSDRNLSGKLLCSASNSSIPRMLSAMAGPSGATPDSMSRHDYFPFLTLCIPFQVSISFVGKKKFHEDTPRQKKFRSGGATHSSPGAPSRPSYQPVPPAMTEGADPQAALVMKSEQNPQQRLFGEDAAGLPADDSPLHLSEGFLMNANEAGGGGGGGSGSLKGAGKRRDDEMAVGDQEGSAQYQQNHQIGQSELPQQDKARSFDMEEFASQIMAKIETQRGKVSGRSLGLLLLLKGG